jgi:CRP/FNR family transcriptional regulator, nitrogen oxide reductase regulator
LPKLHRSLVRHFELFQSIADEDLDAILAVAQSRRIPKGIAVFEQGQVAKTFYVLLDGRLKVFQISPGGEQLVVRFVSPGEIYGVAVALGRLFPGKPRSPRAVRYRTPVEGRWGWS